MQHQLFSNQLSITINALGAELCSVKNRAGLEFIWQADKTIWARHAPVLFPIVGKLKDDTYFFENKDYQLSQHGFARDMVFKLTESNKQSCIFQLEQNDETKSKFPFDFVFKIKYILHENELDVAYQIINPSSKDLFFSIGAHPAFNIPLTKEEQFEDYFIQFSNANLEKTKLLNGLISNEKRALLLNENKLPLSAHLFDEDALIFEDNQINEIGLFSNKSPHKITLSCKNWPFFGIWSKKGTNAFVCLEPWFGIADSVETNQKLEEKKGIIRLKAHQTFNCNYQLSFH